MKNRVIYLILLLLITSSMIGCTMTKEKDELKVTIGDKSIKYKILNGKYEVSKGLFKFAFGGDTFDYINYIDIGEKVYLDFGNNPPDEFIIKDHLLDSEGNLMYTRKEILDVPVTGHNDKYYFIIDKHIASALSSYYEENKKDHRGFAVITTRGKEEKVYVFLMKTDAM